MVAVLPIVTTILTSINTVMTSINTVSTLGRENWRLDGKIKACFERLVREVRMAVSDLEKYAGTDEKLSVQMQELLCDIDDFTSDLSIPEKAVAFFNSLVARDSRPGKIEQMESFMETIKRIGDRQKEISKEGNVIKNLPSAAAPSYALDKDLEEVLWETKKQFEKLLSPAHGRNLRRISIVGCSGLGKTALARALYEATHVPASPPATDTPVPQPPRHTEEILVSPPVASETTPATAVYKAAAAVKQSPPTIEIHGASHLQPSPTTENIHEPTAIDETTLVPPPATTEIHEVITANGATHVQIHGPSETTRVNPSLATTEIHEVVGPNETTHLHPSPPTSEMCEPIEYNCKAWVNASTCKDAKDLVNEILKNVDTMAASQNTSESVKKFLLDKRYLVIIDDLRSCHIQWKDIKHVLPESDKYSRVIVTTSVHSIARDYSSGSYYVYPMERLGEANSHTLFWKNVFGPNPRPPSVPEGSRSQNILAKCDGLPLALISAGNYVCSRNKNPHLSDDRYKEVCIELDNIVASDETTFGDMKTMFVQYYNSLKDYDDMNCLLYFSIYPRGHQIDSKSFIRRLNAEAFGAEENARKCLRNLTDMCMIEPPLTRSNCSVAKRCYVQGMILEFAIHKSVSRNLVTLVEDGNIRLNKPEKKAPQQIKPHNVRRLSVQCTNPRSSNPIHLIPEDIGLSSVRSLTVFKSKHPAAETWVDNIKFNCCKVMRVLDLEGCKGLNRRSVLVCICEMLLLKYLNLKNTDVEELPTEIENLKHLETLDIRQTRVEILSVEVIMLPELARLFGKFLLPTVDGGEKEALVTTFLKEKSKLHTLDGIFINEMKGFEVVIRHARKLKKVKICDNNNSSDRAASAPTPAPRRSFRFRKYFCFSGGSVRDDKHCPNPNMEARGQNDGVQAVSFLQERFMDLESISIDSSGISEAFLACNLNDSVFSSIKIRGPLKSLPPHAFKNLRNLTKIHLFSTGLGSQILVEALQSLDCLEYLKLREEERDGSWDNDFCVQKDGFPALQELCFEGANKYPRVKITQGAMSLLISLQLLCNQSPPTANIENRQSPDHLMRVEGIVHLTRLDEVILHHSTDDATVQAWKEAARNHANMPCVKKQLA